MGILMVYDVSNEESFTNVINWMEQISENASEGVKIILIANKVDVPAEERLISTASGEEVSEQAKEVETMGTLFQRVAERMNEESSEGRGHFLTRCLAFRSKVGGKVWCSIL